jgi:cell division protein ZipA
MIEGLSDTAWLRIGLAVAAVLLFVAIYYGSRRGKPGQGKRIAASKGEAGARLEPTLREILEAELAHEASPDPADHGNADVLHEPEAEPLPGPTPVGARPVAGYDRIVSLFVVARAGNMLSGPDLVVAAEKAGLVYGHMNVFHRMVDNHPEHGPIFSVANLVKPGAFDLHTIKELRTPGIAFFITLPGPLPALDAWDTLLPTAQRMAELLGAVLLDEQRNALGRQRIASIRDELRAYDRAREKLNIKPGR